MTTFSPSTPTRRFRFASPYGRFLSELDAVLRHAGIQPHAGVQPRASAAPSGTPDDPVIGHVQAFVDDHLAADLTVDDLADAAALSPSSLARRFKAETGTTPWRYVMQRRVERAKRLLTETNRSLAAIAFDTGFCDQAHFTHTFRRLEGQTPGAFREDAFREDASREGGPREDGFREDGFHEGASA